MRINKIVFTVFFFFISVQQITFWSLKAVVSTTFGELLYNFNNEKRIGTRINVKQIHSSLFSKSKKSITHKL